MLTRRTFMVTAMAAMATGRPAAGAEGFYAPAEEAAHTRTWMCWPSTLSIYGRRGYFESVQETLGRLAAAIAEHEPVACWRPPSTTTWPASFADPRSN